MGVGVNNDPQYLPHGTLRTLLVLLTRQLSIARATAVLKSQMLVVLSTEEMTQENSAVVTSLHRVDFVCASLPFAVRTHFLRTLVPASSHDDLTVFLASSVAGITPCRPYGAFLVVPEATHTTSTTGTGTLIGTGMHCQLGSARHARYPAPVAHFYPAHRTCNLRYLPA